MRLRVFVLSLCVLVSVAVVGCSSSSTSTTPTMPPVNHPNLYATFCSGTHAVDVFAPPLSGTSTPTITVPFPAPATCALSIALVGNTQIAVGTNGNGWYLFSLPLTNTSAPTVHVTTPGFVGGLIQDKSGNLLVSDTDNNQISLFTPPFTSSSTASVTFSTGLNRPYVLQMNTAGLLFAGNCGGANVTIFTPPFTNASAPSATITPAGGACTEGIGLDAAGNLYVGNFSSPNNVYIYNPPFSNASTPVTTIAGGPTGSSSIAGFAFDGGGNIYISNYGANTITSFAPPLTAASALRFTISTDPQPAQAIFGP